MIKVGTVKSVWRYPVKGMAGEALSEADVLHFLHWTSVLRFLQQASVLCLLHWTSVLR